MHSRESLIKILDKMDIEYEIYDHVPVYTIDDVIALKLEDDSKIVKNLFLRDDKKTSFYLVTMRGNKSLNIKELRRKLASRALSFASEEMLTKHLGVTQGSVTPLALLNNSEKNVIAVFDADLLGEKIGVHPMQNNATIFMDFEDVKNIVQDFAKEVVICDV